MASSLIISLLPSMYSILMRHCNRDTEKHVDLMNLRGRIFGRERVLLAKDGEDMRSPLMVGENLT